jgi:acyl dehydratase
LTTPDSFLTDTMISEAIGTESSPVTSTIETGAIIRFAEAIGDTNPIFNDEITARKSRYGGLIAPPTFLRSMKTMPPEIPFEIPFDRILDGGSSWEYFHPVRANDAITAVGKVIDINERNGRMGLMVFMTTEISYTNQFNDLVATQVNTTIRY